MKKEFDMLEWSKDLCEKLKVAQAYSEFESMRFRGETGMKIMRKLYPWLDEMERKKKRKPQELKILVAEKKGPC